jgi:DNA repair protein RecN (Recombination protein N)
MRPARCWKARTWRAADEIVLRRTLAGDGRSRAFINDEAVGVGLLKDLGSLLLEVHGQQDDRGLFDTATHRLLLDGFGALNGDAQTVAALYGEWAAARTALEELQALARTRPGRSRIRARGGR